MFEQHYSDELAQLKRSEAIASHANKELRAFAMENEARNNQEVRQCKEMVRLRETERTLSLIHI